MDRIQGDTVFQDGLGNNVFGCGNPTANPPTDDTLNTTEWMNGVQEAFCRFIEAQGVTLNIANLDQFQEAMDAFFATSFITALEGYKTNLIPPNDKETESLSGTSTTQAGINTENVVELKRLDGKKTSLLTVSNSANESLASNSHTQALINIENKNAIQALQGKSSGPTEGLFYGAVLDRAVYPGAENSYTHGPFNITLAAYDNRKYDASPVDNLHVSAGLFLYKPALGQAAITLTVNASTSGLFPRWVVNAKTRLSNGFTSTVYADIEIDTGTTPVIDGMETGFISAAWTLT